MPDLSEFVEFVSNKSGMGKTSLVEQDILIHRILRELTAEPFFSGKYLFKGGSCLVKCYYGYYRFSVDLDFTWKDQGYFEVGGAELQRRLKKATSELGGLLEVIATRLGLEFTNEPTNKRYFEFGGSKRTVTFKLWRGSKLVKVQVNFIEALLFPLKRRKVSTLIDGVDLKGDEKAYFRDHLEYYALFEVEAYDEREILCEKVRAVLTRRAQKLRDLYDLYVLHSNGFDAQDQVDDIVKKLRAAMHYRKYRENFEANIEGLELDEGVLENPFERGLFVAKPTVEFDMFANRFLKFLPTFRDKISK